MKLEQIEQILSLADTGSFTETARRLYISQPNLSASVKQLENEIGNIIFERTPPDWWSPHLDWNTFTICGQSNGSWTLQKHFSDKPPTGSGCP